MKHELNRTDILMFRTMVSRVARCGCRCIAISICVERVARMVAHDAPSRFGFLRNEPNAFSSRRVSCVRADASARAGAHVARGLGTNILPDPALATRRPTTAGRARTRRPPTPHFALSLVSKEASRATRRGGNDGDLGVRPLGVPVVLSAISVERTTPLAGPTRFECRELHQPTVAALRASAWLHSPRRHAAPSASIMASRFCSSR